MHSHPYPGKKRYYRNLETSIKEIQLATGRKVKAIQADWGGEFKNGILNTCCKPKGIIQKEIVAYHSETNAIIERLNRTLQDIARTAMIGAELKGLWGDAIKWTAYTKNRIPHENLSGMTPAKVFHSKRSTYPQQPSPFRTKGNDPYLQGPARQMMGTQGPTSSYNRVY